MPKELLSQSAIVNAKHRCKTCNSQWISTQLRYGKSHTLPYGILRPCLASRNLSSFNNPSIQLVVSSGKGGNTTCCVEEAEVLQAPRTRWCPTIQCCTPATSPWMYFDPLSYLLHNPPIWSIGIGFLWCDVMFGCSRADLIIIKVVQRIVWLPPRSLFQYYFIISKITS